MKTIKIEIKNSRVTVEIKVLESLCYAINKIKFIINIFQYLKTLTVNHKISSKRVSKKLAVGEHDAQRGTWSE